MSSGGGTTTTTQNTVSTKELPAWLEDAAQRNIARANMVADIGYTPYYGLDTAGFSDMQNAGFQNTANAASAFGLSAPSNANAYMPKTTTNNLGFTGYSSGQSFDSALAQLAANRPAQYLAIQQQFTDPVTGVASVPTAMDVLTNPNSTDAQIQALYGTAPQQMGGGNSYDPTADTRSPKEIYQDSLKWLAGDAGWIQDAMGSAGLIGTGLSALADWGSKNYVNNYLANNWDTGNNYGVSLDINGNPTTTSKVMADRLGWTFVPPPVVNNTANTNYTRTFNNGADSGNTSGGTWTTTNNNTGYSATFGSTPSFGSGVFDTSGTFGD